MGILVHPGYFSTTHRKAISQHFKKYYKLSFLIHQTLTLSFYDIRGWDVTYRNEFDAELR